MSFSLLDLCIGKFINELIIESKWELQFSSFMNKGPYKNSTFSPGTKSIKGLYMEEYILVVRENDLGFRKYAVLPFAPFDIEVHVHYFEYSQNVKQSYFVLTKIRVFV